MHAAQNELLPLRVVVQVLFFEQARAGMAGGKVADLPPNIKALLTTQEDETSRAAGSFSTTTIAPTAEDQWSVSGLKSPKSKLSNSVKAKLTEDELGENAIMKAPKLKNLCAIPSKPKRMFSKLLSMNKPGNDQKN